MTEETRVKIRRETQNLMRDFLVRGGRTAVRKLKTLSDEELTTLHKIGTKLQETT